MAEDSLDFSIGSDIIADQPKPSPEKSSFTRACSDSLHWDDTDLPSASELDALQAEATKQQNGAAAQEKPAEIVAVTNADTDASNQTSKGDANSINDNAVLSEDEDLFKDDELLKTIESSARKSLSGEDKLPSGEDKPPPGENKPPPGENKSPTGGNKPPPGKNISPSGRNIPPSGEGKPPPSIGFQSASGRKIAVSEKALSEARLLWKETSEDKPAIPQKCSSQPAQIPLSKESLKRALNLWEGTKTSSLTKESAAKRPRLTFKAPRISLPNRTATEDSQDFEAEIMEFLDRENL